MDELRLPKTSLLGEAHFPPEEDVAHVDQRLRVVAEADEGGLALEAEPLEVHRGEVEVEGPNGVGLDLHHEVAHGLLPGEARVGQDEEFHSGEAQFHQPRPHFTALQALSNFKYFIYH